MRARDEPVPNAMPVAFETERVKWMRIVLRDFFMETMLGNSMML